MEKAVLGVESLSDRETMDPFPVQSMKLRRATKYYWRADGMDQIRRNNLALDVQRDPYDNLMSNWEKQMAK